jgi:hypothetical protein
MITLNILVSQIHELNDSDLLEACIYYFSDKFDISSQKDIQEKLYLLCSENQINFTELLSIDSMIEQDRSSYSILLKYLLINYASINDNECQRVQEAVNSVGKKQVVTDLGLAIILGILATMFLIAHTEGKTKEIKEKFYETKPDGTVIFKEKEETFYADASSPLGNLFNLLKNIPKK